MHLIHLQCLLNGLLKGNLKNITILNNFFQLTMKTRRFLWSMFEANLTCILKSTYAQKCFTDRLCSVCVLLSYQYDSFYYHELYLALIETFITDLFNNQYEQIFFFSFVLLSLFLKIPIIFISRSQYYSLSYLSLVRFGNHSPFLNWLRTMVCTIAALVPLTWMDSQLITYFKRRWSSKCSNFI